MKTCDVAVIGLGVMGSAVLNRLAARGVDALGFDPIGSGEQRGSSHGSCRIFRRFNFESPAYTALSDQAFSGWTALAAACGKTLLKPSPLVEAGVPGSTLVAATRAAAGAAKSGPATAAELSLAYPAFRLPADWDVAVQQSAGILLADKALDAFRAPVRSRIIQSAVRLDRQGDELTLTAQDGERWTAGAVVIAAGAWITQFEPRLEPHIQVTRQPVCWLEPKNPGQFQYPDFPLFILDTGSTFVYGFPDFDGCGLKAAEHVHGRVLAQADEARQDAHDAEFDRMREVLKAFVPEAAGAILRREVCLYTNTLGGDVDGSPAEEFILDRLPDEPRIVICSPCSGHGFKFAPAIGELAADLVLDPQAKPQHEFRLGRFRAFA